MAGIHFNIQTRYVVLTSEKLVWFEDNKKAKAIGCANLRLLRAYIRKTE